MKITITIEFSYVIHKYIDIDIDELIMFCKYVAYKLDLWLGNYVVNNNCKVDHNCNPSSHVIASFIIFF